MLSIQEIRSMDDDELLDSLEDTRIEIFNLRFQKESGQLEDMNVLRYAKRGLARLLTVMRERELAAELAEEDKL